MSDGYLFRSSLFCHVTTFKDQDCFATKKTSIDMASAMVVGLEMKNLNS